MAKEVIWTKQALRKLREMIEYLQDEISLQAATNLSKEISKKLELLKKYPEAGRHSKKKKTARFVLIGKHRRMFYRIHGRKIIIVYFFDTRQHPDKSPY